MIPRSSPVAAQIEKLLVEIEPARSKLAAHGIYAALKTPAQLRIFLEHHVFAVWDFMSLVKSLQGTVTCTTVPWVPRGDAALRRLIHEIVLGEESDLDADGCAVSHFELYLRAMRSCGADTTPITRCVDAVARGVPVDRALIEANAPEAAVTFVRHTFSVLASEEPHSIAAAFTFGREDVIPLMFRSFVDELRSRFPHQFDDLAWYLDRHIALDADSHSLLARQLVGALCGNDAGRWRSATEAAIRSLEARLAFWDGITTILARSSGLRTTEAAQATLRSARIQAHSP